MKVAQLGLGQYKDICIPCPACRFGYLIFEMPLERLQYFSTAELDDVMRCEECSASFTVDSLVKLRKYPCVPLCIRYEKSKVVHVSEYEGKLCRSRGSSHRCQVCRLSAYHKRVRAGVRMCPECASKYDLRKRIEEQHVGASASTCLYRRTPYESRAGMIG